MQVRYYKLQESEIEFLRNNSLNGIHYKETWKEQMNYFPIRFPLTLTAKID